jgi:hypothetical protein
VSNNTTSTALAATSEHSTQVEVVNHSSKQVAEYNALHATLINTGLMFPRVQSEKAKQQEAAEDAARAKQQREDAKLAALFAPVREINLRLKSEFPTVGERDAVSYSISETRRNTGTWSRHRGEIIGVTIRMHGAHGVTRNFPFNKSGSINYVKIEALLRNAWEAAASRVEEAKRVANARAAAKDALPEGTLERVKAITKTTYESVTMQVVDGKVTFSHMHYPGQGRSPYERVVFPVASPAAVLRILDIREAAKAQEKAVLVQDEARGISSATLAAI